MLFGKPVPSVDVQEARRMLSEKPAPILVDVRETVEHRQGVVAGSRLIPLGQLSSRLEDIPEGRKVLVICQTGSRSQAAAQQLAKAGRDVTNIRGGISAWVANDLPLKRKGG
ncbi:MAG TPA: rhodanese-like domain-containing protein [Anaerolineales bacterium]|nr:rhodanese-like domain-containing protein [Anaerolineales bacterium]HRF50105.1 rhodanese-like domain-containing protein [Anaerolineales bacterium]